MAVAVKEKRRLDYKAPDYTIDHIDLDITLHENCTRVFAVSLVKRIGQHSSPLILDGEEL